MNEDIRYVMAMSCVLPAVTGIMKYNRIDRRFHPFIMMMLLDVIIETIYYMGIKFPAFGRIHHFTVNIYMFLNFWLFLYFAFINGYLSKTARQVLLGAALFICIINSVYNGSVFQFFYYLVCFVSTVMLVISIDILSRQVMVLNQKLVNNPWFWISSFSIIYNAFTLLVFALYFFALANTPDGKAVAIIQHFVNLACYVFFAVGIARIPVKSREEAASP